MPPSTSLGPLPEWDLSDLYIGIADPRIDADLDTLKTQIAGFATRYRGTVADLDAPELAEAIRSYEALEDLAGRLGSYARLVFAANSADPAISKAFADIQARLTALYGDILFFELEIADLDDAVLDAHGHADALRVYASWLRRLRAARPHKLSADLEKLGMEKDQTGRDAWTRLFDQMMVSMRVPVGAAKLTVTEAVKDLSDPDRAKREAAAKGLHTATSENLSTFALISNTLIKHRQTEDQWRGFASPAAYRHLANDVDEEVVEALATAVREAYPRLSHRYYAWKAREMGFDRLDYWDRTAPLPGADEEGIPWADAQETVLQAFGRFSPAMADQAKVFFDRNWIDAGIRPGKDGGAFSHPTVPSAHPYILMNYEGRPRDVMTLAHELGHGVHQSLCAPLGPILCQTPLTLAETASVFGEMLTFRALLDQERDPARRRRLLAAKVEDKISTVSRQIGFYEFEKSVHAAGRNGELTPDDFNRIWAEKQADSMGPAVDIGGYETAWCLIPHFIHVPFYVYAYAFGDGLVNALYDVYEQSDEGFVTRYLDLLKAGGTRRFDEALAPFGLDARDPAFWSRGLGLIERMLDELDTEQ